MLPELALAAPGTGARTRSMPQGRAPLVGREQELAFLADGWQAALAGGCSLLLVSGEAGVGKTRLVQEFADRLRWQGARVLKGRCYEFERLLPLPAGGRGAPSVSCRPRRGCGRCASLPDWVIAQVARLAPDIVPYDHRPLAARGARPAERSRGRRSGCSKPWPGSCPISHRQQPLLLVLEDLHWATDSTLQLLHYLARALLTQPALIVGTLRPEAVPPAHPLATLGRRLERDGLARRLKLSRLSSAAVACADRADVGREAQKRRGSRAGCTGRPRATPST